MNARLRVFLLTLCLTSTGIALNARVEAEEAPTAKVSGTALTLGRVTTNPKKHVPGLEALGRYLVARLGDMGITENRVVLARDNEHMIELLRRREVDLVSETPFTALTFEKKVGAEILLREWKKGVSSYHTVFFTRKDSAIQSLQDLVGKTVAFEDPGSTSAYFVPMLTLRRAGLALVDVTARGTDRETDRVNFVFSHSESTSLAWVARGRVDAGVLSNLEWTDPPRAATVFIDQLRIFHETAPVIRSVILARRGLDAGLKLRIKQILVAMDQSAEGRATLKKFAKVKKYDEITGEAKKQLDHVRLLFSELQ